MARTTTGQLFADMLVGYGVTHVFFLPAIFHSGMVALEDASIRRINTHHEIAAAYMADGYARAARRPGVCMAQSVGAINLAAGLRDAHLASVPVIAITGGRQPEYQYRYLYQMIEDLPMFDPVTKMNVVVGKPERLADLLRQAFRCATTGTPGPVHLELPGRLGECVDGTVESEPLVEKRFSRYPAYRPVAGPDEMREAIRMLQQAQRPVLLAGAGAVASGAAREVVRLAEKLSIPVALSPSGKDIIPESHPLALGVVGTYGRRSANESVIEADVVFFVGSRVGGLVTGNWHIPPPGATILQLDIAPDEIGRNYPVRVELLGDARATLRRMAAMAAPADHGEWVRSCQEKLQGWRREASAALGSDAVPIRPERICREISEFLPARSVVVCDTGHAAIWTGSLLHLDKPGQRYIRCAGTLGWAFPAALGTKCALPQTPVLCFTGDGGFLYHLAELETAARAGINAVILVNNNSALQQVRRGIDAAYGGQQRGRAKEMWMFRETNLARVAEEMGCLGIRVEQPDQIRPALQRAFRAGRPAVIDVASDVNAAPAWG